jgi:nucleoside-diphosphate-sugar epimerase
MSESRSVIVEEDLQRIVGRPLPWADLANATVLVTGASGFLPAYMVESLLYRNEIDDQFGVHVVALVHDERRGMSRFSHYAGRDDLSIVVQDASDPLEFGGPIDVIVHAASNASPRFFGVSPIATMLPNVLGTMRLLQESVARSVSKFMFLSSGEVYGEVSAEQVPTRECDFGTLDPAAVRSCYAEGKRMGETMCAAWTAEHGVHTRIVRPFHTYGPGVRLDDGRVFADFIADVVAGRDIVMRSDGSARRAFCYLADATAGFFTALLLGEDALPYNVGNEEAETSIVELANMVAGLFPEKGLRVIREERSSQSSYLVSQISRNMPDTSRLRALGWAPETTLEAGFKRTIRCYL